ncbi:sugar ABC transporter ATP-binding protein [Jiella sp. M17.18]|uniref:sugar ABC transporter ATP-binding protein n=1 Tax=Jiella sp. M17.18 TaxID=3234247 RepID=UPI0034DE6F77
MATPVSERPVVAANAPPLVEMCNIGKRFGENEVLRGVGFDVRPGEVHALLGGNGAGKSTLMKILMGVHRADSGQIRVDGEEVAPAGVRGSLSRGVAMIFQELSLLPNLTVAENIFFGREPLRAGFRIDRRAVRAKARDLLAEYGFTIPVDARVESLPFAQRQVVEIVRAASFGARVLIMDEPTSALTAREEEKLFELIEDLTRRGNGIVYISHRMGEIMRIADRITILRDGLSGAPIPIADARIDDISAQLSSTSRALPEADQPLGQKRAIDSAQPPVLRLQNVTTARTLKDIDLSVMQGEIVGIAGLVGSGRSTLCKAIAGLVPDVHGTIELGGTRIRPGRPHAVLGKGLGFVPEDRRLEGLVIDHALEANVALPNLRHASTGGPLGMVWHSRVRELFTRGTEGLALVARGPSQPAAQLSGGNQQKVVVAKWLASRPRLLILDEPTAGVDIRAKADMGAALRKAVREDGLSILLINSELDELVSLCDRILLLERGRIVGTAPDGVDPAQLQALLLGGNIETIERRTAQ